MESFCNAKVAEVRAIVIQPSTVIVRPWEAGYKSPPATSQPAPGYAATSQAATSQRATSQLAASQQASGYTTCSQAASSQHAASGPTYSPAAMSQATARQQATSQPTTSQLTFRSTVIRQPDTHHPVTVKPLISPVASHSIQSPAASPSTYSTVLSSHLQLLEEIRLVPRSSLTSTLWINSLLHSYMMQINTLPTEYQRHQLINQTRDVLHAYSRMMPSNSLYAQPTASPQTSQAAPLSTPTTQNPHTIATPDTGYSSFSANKSSDQESSPDTGSAPAAQASSSSSAMKFLPPCARYILEDWYKENMECPYATDAIADDLARHCQISKLRVLKWLSNRRNRDGNTKKTVGRRRNTEYNRAKPYDSKHKVPQMKLSF